MGLVNINGLIVPLLTPMCEDFEIDEISLKALTARLMNKGVKNFFILSSLGEAFNIDKEKQKKVIQLVSKIVQRGNILIGCFDDSTEKIIEKVRFAERYSDYCVINVPFSALTNEVFFIDFFDELFKRTRAKIILCNDPFNFKRNIPIVGIDRIANWEKLIGVIDFSRNITYFRSLSDYKQSMQIFQGVEEQLVEAFSNNCSGLVAGLANISPTYFLGINEGANISDINFFIRKEANIQRVMKAFFPFEKRIQSYKYVLAVEGITQPFHSKQIPSIAEEEKIHLEEFVKSSFA